MQVPASVTTVAAENAAAGTSSSLFGALAGASSAKKGQLPPFVAILAEQSSGTDSKKDIGTIVRRAGHGGADEVFEATLPGTAHVSPEALLSALPVEVKNVGDAQNKTQSGASASSKSETKTVRHRTNSASLSSVPEKKKSFVATEAVPSAVSAAPLMTAQVISAVAPEKWSRSLLDASLPSGTARLPQHSSLAQNHNEESGVESPASSSPVAKPDETPLAADFSKQDLHPRPISSAKVQLSSTSLASEVSEATASIPESVVRSRQVSSGADILLVSSPSDGLNSAVQFAGSVAQAATSQATAGSLSKSKTQEKANGDIVRGLSASPDAVRASSMDTVPLHGFASAMGPSVRIADPVDSSPKQELSMPDANIFQRLDSGGTPATLFHSSAHQIAVGVHDPSLGWLEVQTQSSAGHISATLTAASTEAHASLAAQAPAITQYLVDRNVSVHSVNVHAQADTQSGASSGGGQSQSGTGNTRHEVSEHGASGMEESRSSSLSQTGSEHTQQTSSSSYISIHA